MWRSKCFCRFSWWSSPDGKLLAAAVNSQVPVRDAATHVKLTTLSPAIGDASIATLAFSPDGKMLAISGGTTLRLWHVSGRQQIRDPFISINNPDDYVTAAAFSADSRILAISTDHGAVQLWDIATDQEIGAPLISSPSDPVSSLAFSPNGQILAAGSNDGTVRRWNVAYLYNVAPSLCAAAGRALTKTEWDQYAQGISYENICPGWPARLPQTPLTGSPVS